MFFYKFGLLNSQNFIAKNSNYTKKMLFNSDDFYLYYTKSAVTVVDTFSKNVTVCFTEKYIRAQLLNNISSCVS